MGRAVVERYLKGGINVIITSSQVNTKKVLQKISQNGLPIDYIQKNIQQGSLRAIPGIVFGIGDTSIGYKLSKYIEPGNVSGIINLIIEPKVNQATQTEPTTSTSKEVVGLAKHLRLANDLAYLCCIGSTSENREDKATAPYEASKIASKHLLLELCNLYITVGYLVGKGRSRLKDDTKKLLGLLRISKKWLFGFEVSYIDVDDLADIMFDLLEGKNRVLISDKRIEAFATSGEVIFGELVHKLLPPTSILPKSLLRGTAERTFLRIFSVVAPIILKNNQFIRRISSFAHRSGGVVVTHYVTSSDIEKLTRSPKHQVVSNDKNLIVSERFGNKLFILTGRTNS